MSGATFSGSPALSSLSARIDLDDNHVPVHFRKDAPQDPHQRRRHDAILAALRKLPAGRVLDYGCGWGDIAWAMSRTHPDIHAVDVDPERVAFARREYAPLPFSACADDGVDFADASFDIVMSVVVLPFVPSEDGYLSEVRRVLKPGGHLVLATKICPLLRRTWHRLNGHPERSRFAPDARRNHLPGDVRGLLAAHGFRVLGESGFYDPPFEARKNGADVVNGGIEFLGELFGAVATAPYRVFVARLADTE